MANVLLGRKGKKFTLLRELGRGGFGVVHLAERDDKNQYAVKLIGPVEDPTIEETFGRELAAAAAVNHPNVLKVIDFGSTEDAEGNLFLFAATEYCSGGDYRRVLSARARSGLDIDLALAEIEQVLKGLEALHTKVIHRDLKPENVFVKGDVLKIGDFGLSKFVDEATKTLTFKGGGSPRYMAPEVWTLKRATAATDLYAIGVMLFEALAGRPPFVAKDANEIRDLHLYAPAPRVRSINPAVTDKLDGIVKKLLIKEPSGRYQSVNELVEALRTLHAPRRDAAIASIAAQARAHHDSEEAKRLELQKAHEVRQRDSERKRYKEIELVELLDEVIDEVNSHLEEVKIKRNPAKQAGTGPSRSGSSTPTYTFGSRSLVVHFFREGEIFENPQVPGRMEILRKRYVVHGGYIEIKEHGEDREGWNLILVQPPESMYGDWIIVETEVSAFVAYDMKYKPMATEARLLADNLACHWMPAMHTYQLKTKNLERTDLIKIVQKFIPNA